MVMLKTIIFAFVIFCEAKGEPFKGKLAVGEVLEYRSTNLKSIFGKNQFAFNTKLCFDDLKIMHECLAAGFLTANGFLFTGKVKSHFNSNNRKPKGTRFVSKIGNHKFYMEKNND